MKRANRLMLPLGVLLAAAAGSVATTGITLRQLVDEYGLLPPLPVTAP